jgi:hypothetical protein
VAIFALAATRRRSCDPSERLAGLGDLGLTLGRRREELSLPDVPFDERSGLIRNDGIAGEYVVGWIQRGPYRVIGTNNRDAADTAALTPGDGGAAAPESLSAVWHSQCERMLGVNRGDNSERKWAPFRATEIA